MSFAPSDLKRGFGQKPEIELSGTLKKEHNDQSPHVVTSQQGGEGVGVAFTASDRSNKAAWEGDISGTINCQMNSESSNLQMGVRENLTVRRLTPIECERLQGFPDNWTSEKMELILEGNEWKATGKVVKQADGPRYKADGQCSYCQCGCVDRETDWEGFKQMNNFKSYSSMGGNTASGKQRQDTSATLGRESGSFLF